MSTREVYFSNLGVPATGLILTWEYLFKVSDNSAVVGPAFTEIGGGWYKFDIDPTERYVGVIDGSVTLPATERYQPVYFDIYDYLYEIYVQPSYNEDTDALTFLCWLMKNGKLVKTSMTNCEIEVYDSANTLLFTITAVTPTNGIFTLTKSAPGLTDNLSYYCVATITEDGVDHESTDTFISLE